MTCDAGGGGDGGEAVAIPGSGGAREATRAHATNVRRCLIASEVRRVAQDWFAGQVSGMGLGLPEYDDRPGFCGTDSWIQCRRYNRAARARLIQMHNGHLLEELRDHLAQPR